MRDLRSRFVASSASVIGQMHRRRGQGGQDGSSPVVGDGWAVAIVADGVSASPGSEIGARIASRWIAAKASRELMKGTAAADPAVIAGWVDALTERLQTLSLELAWPDEDPVYAIADFFLFTLLIAVVDQDRYCVAGIGDGVVAADGRYRVLEPEGAGPTCPMYARVDPKMLDAPLDTSLKVHFEGRRRDVRQLVVATDGCLEFLTQKPPQLDQLFSDPVGLQRPMWLQAQLEHLCARQGWPQDDTTIAVISAVG